MTLHIGKRQPPHYFGYFESRKIDIFIFAKNKNTNIDDLYLLEQEKYEPLSSDEKSTHEKYINDKESGLIDSYALWDLAHTLIYLFETKYFKEIILCFGNYFPEIHSFTNPYKEDILENIPFRIKSIADKADLIHTDILNRTHHQAICKIYFSVLLSAQKFKKSLRKYHPYDADQSIDHLYWRGKNLFELFSKGQLLAADVYNEEIEEIFNSFLDLLKDQTFELLRVFKMPNGNHYDKSSRAYRISRTRLEKIHGEEILRNNFIDHINSLSLEASKKFKSIDDFINDYHHHTELIKILEEYQTRMTDNYGKILTYGKEIEAKNLPRLFKKWRGIDRFSEALSNIIKAPFTSQSS